MTRSLLRPATVLALLLWATPALAGYYRARVMKTQYGQYNAFVEYVTTDGNVDGTEKIGTYDTKKAAKRAARKATKKRNKESGVKAGDPVCDLPNVFC